MNEKKSKSKNKKNALIKNTTNENQSINKTKDPNAFDPEKFLLLVDENYTYNKGN